MESLTPEINQLNDSVTKFESENTVTNLEKEIIKLNSEIPNVEKLKEQKKNIEENILNISKKESTLTEITKNFRII